MSWPPSGKTLIKVVGGAQGGPACYSGQSELLHCDPGEAVSLRRVGDDPDTPAAIAVLSVRGVCIGYLGPEDAVRIAPAIEEGLPHSAILHELEGGAGGSIYHARIEITWQSNS